MATLETERSRDLSLCWSPENFANSFGFRQLNKGFIKELAGKRYLFRRISSPNELQNVIDIQRKAWDWKDIDIAPTHILALMDDTGGGIFGAFDNRNELVAFAAGFGGGTDTLTNKPTLISSMLAVGEKPLRSIGIGRELKLVQAFHAYRNGYHVMKWFYDPERGENASLNLTKLGARAEEFHINKYGQMASGLYGPVPTDRFRAVWRFTSPSVIERLLRISHPPSLEDVEGVPIATSKFFPDRNRVIVQISENIDAEPEKEKIRRRFRLRQILSHYFFKKGYIATEFITGIKIDKKTNLNKRVNFYLLEPLLK